jgi:hypothetical protein
VEQEKYLAIWNSLYGNCRRSSALAALFLHYKIQLHVPAAFSQEKEALVSIGGEAGWASEPV